jgi:hypothetical protein
VLLAALLLACPGPPSRAQTDSWDLARLMTSLRGVRVAEARFEESRQVSLLNQTLLSSGRLSYRAPDRLEKLTTAPQPARLTLNGDLLTLEQPGAATRTIALGEMPQVGALVGAIRWTLSGDLAALSAAFAITLDGDSAGWTLELVPRDDSVRALVRRVLISGVGVSLRAVRTEEADGDRDDMTILPDPP